MYYPRTDKPIAFYVFVKIKEDGCRKVVAFVPFIAFFNQFIGKIVFLSHIFFKPLLLNQILTSDSYDTTSFVFRRMVAV
jgi:hypothetical protein